MLRRLLATWGNADFGRLGHGAIESQMLPRVVEVLKEENIVQVSSGGAHTAAVAADGSLYTFGLNDFGQLGHSQGEAFCEVPREVLVPESVVSVSCGHYHTIALSVRLWAFGKNSNGQLGIGRRSGGASPLPSLVRDLDGAAVEE
eukprot:CAMPEP_0177600378 /NCGR_PEP_ID=MMETSP0419_2-20121207/13587_1 /TAXON_ID=582737 /ORGANISM="Tetraselmis sp., Strain GSL018" /LENGTH=144 /DNA_ID=CAMNT_0019093359 /DNA_START=193 /DNA_END=624 /DNA_ORIENTATION=-